MAAIVAKIDPGAPVHGCLCFLNPEGFVAESGLPVLRTLEMNGYRLYSPRKLARRFNGEGPLSGRAGGGVGGRAGGAAAGAVGAHRRRSAGPKRAAGSGRRSHVTSESRTDPGRQRDYS